LTDLAERPKLTHRAAEFLRPRLQLGQQAGVLDGDHRLVGEGLEECDLVVGEPARLPAGHSNCSDRLVVMEHRHHD
jgi:hypothetical protein